MTEPEKIICPACESEISTDGRTLHKRSARLTDLEETQALVPKLKEKLDAAEAQAKQPPIPKLKRERSTGQKKALRKMREARAAKIAARKEGKKPDVREAKGTRKPYYDY